MVATPFIVSLIWPLTKAMVADADLLKFLEVFKYVSKSQMTPKVIGITVKTILGNV